jgi:hypothetical protein
MATASSAIYNKQRTQSSNLRFLQRAFNSVIATKIIIYVISSGNFFLEEPKIITNMIRSLAGNYNHYFPGYIPGFCSTPDDSPRITIIQIAAKWDFCHIVLSC